MHAQSCLVLRCLASPDTATLAHVLHDGAVLLIVPGSLLEQHALVRDIKHFTIHLRMRDQEVSRWTVGATTLGITMEIRMSTLAYCHLCVVAINRELVPLLIYTIQNRESCLETPSITQQVG
eukprot:6172751-Pleurochrysis_carterae.AAC.3